MQQISRFIIPSFHIVFWLTGYSLAFIFIPKPYFLNPAVWITFIIAFYLNVYWLFPKYLSKDKNWPKHALLISTVLAGVTILEFTLEYLFELPPVYIDGRTQKILFESVILVCAMTFLKALLVLPLSFLFQFAKDLIVLKKVSVFAEISLHILIIGMLYLLSMMTPPYWAPEFEPFLFLFKAGYKFLILAIHLSFFYLNAFWFIPKLLGEKRYALYFFPCFYFLLFRLQLNLGYITCLHFLLNKQLH